MACLLWWVEGEVEQQRKKKKKKSGQYALSMGSLTQQEETDQQRASAAPPMRGHLNPSPANFKTILTNSITPELTLPYLLPKQTNKAGVLRLQLI